MHTIILGNKRKRIAYPAKWEEVTGEQLVKIAEILHSGMRRGEALVRILMVLTGMRKQNLWVKWAWHFRVTMEFRYDCMKSIEWVLDTDMECTDNKLPVIYPPDLRHPLYGPLKECRGFVFLEFIEADMAYLDFRKDFMDMELREAALNRLVAILYRDRNADMPRACDPKNSVFTRKGNYQQWNGDPRCAYNGNILDYRVREVAGLSAGVKYAILMFYHACHKRWEGLYPDIFKKVKSDQAESGGWSGALMALAGGSINVERMLEVNAAAALSDLNDRIVNSKKD